VFCSGIRRSPNLSEPTTNFTKRQFSSTSLKVVEVYGEMRLRIVGLLNIWWVSCLTAVHLLKAHRHRIITQKLLVECASVLREENVEGERPTFSIELCGGSKRYSNRLHDHIGIGSVVTCNLINEPLVFCKKRCRTSWLANEHTRFNCGNHV